MDNNVESLAFSRFQPEAEAGRQRLSRAARSGSAERIVRGAYMSADEWARLDDRGRYLARVQAVAATRRARPVISHVSAAAIHGLPVLDRWPRAVHISVLPGIGTHNRSDLVKHTARVAAEDLVQVGDLLVTSVARTVVDIAASETFMTGVVCADGALFADERHGRFAMLSRDELRAALAGALPLRAHARAHDVVEFAETGAQTAIESVSRVNMKVLKAPRPLLQTAHFDDVGFIGSTDFYWPEHGAIGEADGDRKYLDIASRSGRTVEQVLLEEKRREDRLRALPRKVSRWPWSVALDPLKLRRKLQQLGLPLNVPWE